MSELFTASRLDGRSDRQVIYDAIHLAPPETLYSDDQLRAILGEGLKATLTISVGRIYGAVASANKPLLQKQRRYLQRMKGYGYRLVRSDEHLPIAIGKKGIAENYLRRGLEILKNTRLDELEEPQRSLHAGQLMVMAGIYQVVRYSERRHAEQEQAIEDLRTRIASLEKQS